MKTTFKILIYLLILAVITFALLQIDDELTPEAEQFFEQMKNKSSLENEAYFYFLGFSAPPEKNPIEVGKSIHLKTVKQAKEFDKAAFYNEGKIAAPAQNPFIINEAIELILPTVCANFNISQCFAALEKEPHLLDKLISDNPIWLERHQHFMQYQDFQGLYVLGYPHLFPDHSTILKAQKLSLLNLLTYKEQPEILQKKYHSILNHNKLMLAQSSNLLDKMVNISLLNMTLDFYNLLYIKDYVIEPKPFQKLTNEELSVRSAMEFEIANMESMIYIHSNGFNFLSQTFYKPNMQKNRLYQQIKIFSDFESLPLAQQLISELSSDIKISSIDKIRNYLGLQLNSIGSSAYKDYILRTSDLQAKIAVLNWRLQQPVDVKIDKNYLDNQDTASLNLYKTGAFEIKDDKLVCINTPKNDHRNIRCVEI